MSYNKAYGRIRTERGLESKIFFFVGILCMILLTGSVSAFNFDNSVKYSNNDLKVDFVNSFGLGKDLGSAELKSHNSVDEILEVGTGNQVVMFYDFSFNELYENGLGEITFTDQRTDEEVERNYKFVYWGDIEVNNYETICEEVSIENGTLVTNCEQIVTGTHIEKGWVDYNSLDVPKGKIRIGIEVEVRVGDFIDGVWEIVGKKVSRHAQWTQDLNTNLIAYWNFNESSGNLLDLTGNGYNGVLSGGVSQGETGIIENGYYFNDSESGWIGFNDINLTGQSFTVNEWFYFEDSTNEYFIGNDKENGENTFRLGIRQATGNWWFYFGGGSTANEGASATTGAWVMITGIYDAGADNMTMYVNAGVQINDDSYDIGNNNVIINAMSRGDGTEYIKGYGDEVGVWNRTLSSDEITQLYNSGSGITWTLLLSDYPSVTLNSPINYYNSTSQTINFNCTASDDINLANVSFYLDGVLNYTNSSGLNNTDYIFSRTLTDGEYNWTCEATDNESQTTTASYRYFGVDSISPNITIIYPTNGSTYTDNYTTSATKEITMNWTTSDTNLDTCWYYNGTANTTIACGNNATFNISYGTHTFKIYANDTFGHLTEEDVTATWEYRVLENSRTYNATSYETADEGYSVNVTANSSLTGVSLNYNGSSYSMTNEGSGIYSYSRTLPESWVGNNSFNFSFTYSGDTINSSTDYQNVLGVVFDLCNATLTTAFVNYTFKDEGNLSAITAQIPTSTFTYWLGDGSVNKTLTFTNTTENLRYEFCFSPSDRTLNVDEYIQYKNAGSPQRIYNPSQTTFTNVTTNKTLYLLSTADGLYVTYQVLDSGGDQLQGVDVNATRVISGETVLIGTGQTDSAGAVTFWMNPDFLHTSVFAKSGYTTYTFNHFPTQSTYTITLGPSSSSAIIDYLRGILYSIKPAPGTFLTENTMTNFNLTLNSSYWNLSSFGFNIYGNQTLLTANSSSSATGGILQASANTSNYSSMTMSYYWVINGTTTNASVVWIVYNSTGTDWSILNLATDIKAYATQGIFGLDNDSLNLIIFILIFCSVGIISYKFGLQSPAAVSGMVFALVAVFDYGLGMINIGKGVQYFPTIFTLLITVALTLREVTK